MMALSRKVPWPANLDYRKQSVEVPGTKKSGQTGHYRCGAFGFITLDEPNSFKTTPELFDAGLALSRNEPCLGHRPITSHDPLTFAKTYIWLTYAEVDVRRRAIGSAVHALFNKGLVGGGDMQTVGIWSCNRPEWQIIDLALQAYNKVGVSLYDTLGKDSIEYIINHAHITLLFTTAEHIPTLLKLASRTPHLKVIVVIDDLAPDVERTAKEWADTLGLQLLELRELEKIGKNAPLDPIQISPEDVVSICYTSGTTSQPKGVVLTHGNLAAAIFSGLHGTIFPGKGVILSYLPLAHIYGRICELAVIAEGGRIGYFTNSPLRLLEDAQILRPTFFPSVPRILNRIYQSAMTAGDVPGLKGDIFRKAVRVKLQELRKTGWNQHRLWDRLVFSKVRAVLGGEVQTVTCGSAPIAPDVMNFLRIALCCDVTEGYGMTENCGTCLRVWPNDPTSAGSVGPPQPCNEVKLVDVTSMGYTAEDKPYPRGELYVRGTNCFRAYFKDEKNTRETVDAEGWIRTGDIALVDECGRFRLIDRVKNIMKLAQGEYVAIEKIENLYSASPVAQQIFVHGDSLQSFLLAVVVPDPIQLAAIARKILGRNISPEDTFGLQAVVQEPLVREAIMKELDKEAKRNALKGFETIKRIHVTFEPFSVDNGTLTPTLKLRRKDAYNMYKLELDTLYALGDSRESERRGKL